MYAMEKPLLPLFLLSMCLVFKGDEVQRRARLYELLHRTDARESTHEHTPQNTYDCNAGLVSPSTPAMGAGDVARTAGTYWLTAHDAFCGGASDRSDSTHTRAALTSIPISLAGVFSFDDFDDFGSLGKGDDTEGAAEAVSQLPEMASPERLAMNVSLEKYIRLGLDSTITEDIPWVKRERLKQALEGFLVKFFVYDREQHRVVFMTEKVTYADVEHLYKKLKRSKNLLGQGATFLGIKDDPLGDSFEDFLVLLADETSPIYATFSSCTQGVVGHMQQKLKEDLDVDDVPMLTDRGELIVPTMFAKTLRETRK